MAVPEALSRAVRSRAHGRCEYCFMHESVQGATFDVEHVNQQSKGGESTLDTLALPRQDATRIKPAGQQPLIHLQAEQVPLFHPVQQRWSEHFRFKGCEVEGRTAVGRATVVMLDLNHFRRQRIRQVEEVFGLYPPTR